MILKDKFIDEFFRYADNAITEDNYEVLKLLDEYIGVAYYKNDLRLLYSLFQSDEMKEIARHQIEAKLLPKISDILSFVSASKKIMPNVKINSDSSSKFDFWEKKFDEAKTNMD